MRSIRIASMLLSVAFLAGSAFAQVEIEKAQVKPIQGKMIKVGDKVDPSIALKDINGKQHKIKDYEGKIVVLDFWSIECPVSKAYEARFKALQEKYAGKDVVFLAIAANHTEVDAKAADPYAKIREYVKDQKVTMPILIDQDNVIADRLEAKVTPHVFIIDKAGKLVYSGAVDNDDDKASKGEAATNYVGQNLDALLEGKEVPHKSNAPRGCKIQRVSAKG
jgi:thiol-disulfide isomerase/thioredoxin